MKNFIEVGKTEDEQAEQIKKWIKENGPQIIAGIVLGLGGIWGLSYSYGEVQKLSFLDTCVMIKMNFFR